MRAAHSAVEERRELRGGTLPRTATRIPDSTRDALSALGSLLAWESTDRIGNFFMPAPTRSLLRSAHRAKVRFVYSGLQKQSNDFQMTTCGSDGEGSLTFVFGCVRVRSRAQQEADYLRVPTVGSHVDGP